MHNNLHTYAFFVCIYLYISLLYTEVYHVHCTMYSVHCTPCIVYLHCSICTEYTYTVYSVNWTNSGRVPVRKRYDQMYSFSKPCMHYQSIL